MLNVLWSLIKLPFWLVFKGIGFYVRFLLAWDAAEAEQQARVKR